MGVMGLTFPTIRGRLDRAGMILSSLCAVHCVLGIVIVAGLGLGGGILLDPAIHRIGLLLATIIAGVAIGIGAIQHRRAAPFVVAMTGLTFMGGGPNIKLLNNRIGGDLYWGLCSPGDTSTMTSTGNVMDATNEPVALCK